MKHGKKYVDGAKLIERSRLYDTQEALDLCVKTGTAKFDETVEVHVKLGVDGRHADQQVRGAIVLPHGTGKTVRVLAICKPEKEDEARAAGAEFVGGNDMIQKIQSELPALDNDISEEEAAFTEAAEEQLAQTQAQRRYFYLRR